VAELARDLPRLDSGLRLDVLLRPAMRDTDLPRSLESAGARVFYAASSVASVRQWFEIPGHIRRLRPDLYHYPFFDLPSVPCRSVITVYDLNPQLDINYFPRQRRWRQLAARGLLQSSLRRCRIAVAISDATRRLLEQNFPRARGKTRTIHLGVEPEYWTISEFDPASTSANDADRAWTNRPYVLYVGVDRPHKNLLRLVRAFSQFRAQGPWSTGDGPYLWLAGIGRGSDQLRAEIHDLGRDSDVRCSDPLSEPALASAYRNARLVAYVSTSEGFGLPLLEAFASGVPVVAGNCSSLPEVGGDAAHFVPVDDDGGIAQGLQLVWSDDTYRRTLIGRGRVRVQQFTWERTARQTLQAYRDALSG
jgi:alpha-1,3-rhamnosyl/mannosyltransferase